MDLSTKLALDRTNAAYERTMQAWIRTGTSLITFGFSVYKFFELESVAAARSLPHKWIGPHEFAVLMVLAGLGALVLGAVEHQRRVRALRVDYPDMPRNAVSVMAIALSGLGIFMLVVVVFRQ